MEPRLSDPGERWKFLRDNLPRWAQRLRRGLQNHARRRAYSSIWLFERAAARGTVYQLATSGTLTRLHSFSCNNGNCPDGEIPVAQLVQGSDGDLYGTTRGVIGGVQTNDGTIFKITTGGEFTTLHHFAYTDGAWPSAALIQAANGNFYGTTFLGGRSNCTRTSCGTVFSLSLGLSSSRKP